MSAPHYPCGTIAQMAAIPAEARGRFLAELPAILDHVAASYALADNFNDAFAGLMEMIVKAAVWVDDDLQTVTNTFDFGDGSSVEVKRPLEPSA